jgi:hypothetical protein
MAIVLETSLTHLLVFIFSLLSQLYTLHLNNNATLSFGGECNILGANILVDIIV